MNTSILIGNLARDPELRYTNNGKAVVNMTVAVGRFGKKDEADFIRVIAWEKLAENCANFLSKGSKVGVQGRIQTRQYESKEGDKRTAVEVIANSVEFLSPKSEGNGNGAPAEKAATSSPAKQAKGEEFNPEEEINLEEFNAMDDDEDLPF